MQPGPEIQLNRETAAHPQERAKPGPWSAFFQSVIRIERGKVAPWLAARNALGIALPLAFGIAFGTISSAVVVSTGALNVAFSDSSDPYVHRARRMFALSILVAIAVFSGTLCGHNPIVVVAVTTVWAFVAGIVVALGAAAADIGVITLVTLVVFAAQPMGLERAALSGLLALAGGMLQTLLALALWPVRRYDPERRALGDLYLELSRAAAAPVKASEAPPASAQSTQAQQSLAALGRDRSIEGERLRLLLSQAERMRLSLLMLARLRARMQRAAILTSEVERLDRSFAISARLLNSIGESLIAGAPAAAAPECLAELHQSAEDMRDTGPEREPSLLALISDARFQMDALAGQFRSAVDLAAHSTAAGLEAFEQHEASQPWILRLSGTMATLRANLSLKSTACRHALRLAACIAVGEILAHSVGWHRSYWLPMTIAIVLKPDFTATFSRGVLRLAGTFAGLILATALFHLLHPAVGAEVALIALLAFVLRCFGSANYGIFVTAITAFVVVEFALTGIAPKDVMAARALNSAVGGAIALLAYWIWPTWERTQVPEAMAQMLDAYRKYFRAVRESYVNPSSQSSQELDKTRVQGRLARSNLEASVDRLSAEPGVSVQTLNLLNAMLATSHRLVHAMMALEAGLIASSPVRPRDTFMPFADHVELTLYYLASALRGSSVAPSNLPDLREDHHALIHSGDSQTDRYALVNVETDRVTNSLNTLSEQVLSWLAPDVHS